MAPEVKSPPVCAKGVGDSGLLPGSGGLPWRPTWPPAPRLLPGRSHGQRSLVGYSPGSKASDTAERLSPHTGLLTSWLSHCISPVVMASGGITGLYRTNQVGRITRDGGGTLVVQGGEPCWRSKRRTPRWGAFLSAEEEPGVPRGLGGRVPRGLGPDQASILVLSARAGPRRVLSPPVWDQGVPTVSSGAHLGF